MSFPLYVVQSSEFDGLLGEERVQVTEPVNKNILTGIIAVIVIYGLAELSFAWVQLNKCCLIID